MKSCQLAWHLTLAGLMPFQLLHSEFLLLLYVSYFFVCQNASLLDLPFSNRGCKSQEVFMIISHEKCLKLEVT